MNAYGESKAVSERLLPWFDSTHGIRSAALRYFNAAGAADDGSRGEDWSAAPNLVPVVLKTAAGRRPDVRIFGTDHPTPDGTAIRDYIHVLDLAAAHRCALEAIAARDTSLTVNVGTGVGASVLEVIDAARRITGREIPAEAAPRREGDPSAIWADTSRAEEVLDWRATRTLDDIVRSAWAWHSAHPDGYRDDAPVGRRGAGRMSHDGTLTVAYVMSRFPKLTETFILAELEAMDRAGVRIELHPLLRQTGEPVQPAAVRWVERAHYLPFLSPAILRSQWTFLRDRRRRRRYLRAFADLIGGTWRSPNFLLGGLGIFPKVVHASLQMVDEGVDHVHCHFANHPALAGWLIHRLVGIPYSFTAHGSDLHVDRTMLPAKVAESAFAVTISADNRALIEATCAPAAAGKVEVIHCGIDPATFRPTEAHGDGPLRIIAVGTLHEVKGQVHLIEACRSLADRGIAFSCTFIGDGPDRAALESRVAELGLAGPGDVRRAVDQRRRGGRAARRGCPRGTQRADAGRQARGDPGRADGGDGDRSAGRGQPAVGHPRARHRRRRRPARTARRRHRPRRCPGAPRRRPGPAGTPRRGRP